MKFARILAACAAVMLVATGCTARNNGNNTSSNTTVPDVASSVREGISEAESRIEEGVSRLEDDLDMSDHDASADASLPEESAMPDGSAAESMPATEPSEITDESISAAMSTDFSEIGALDGTLDNGFPGGPVDEQNRPSGPIAYQEKYGKYDAYFIIPDSQKVFLTFDEGYENGYTGKILDVLKEKNVKAVFFITYPYAKTEPALVKRMVDEGHTLGNHSTEHRVFPEMPLTEAAKDIMKLHEYVKANFGYEMFLFRPPEGAFSEQTLALTQSLGYKSVLWSFAYKDYDVNAQPLTLEATERVVSKAHPGEICLLHAVSKTNAEILGDVIDQIRAEGYEFADYFAFTNAAS